MVDIGSAGTRNVHVTGLKTINEVKKLLSSKQENVESIFNKFRQVAEKNQFNEFITLMDTPIEEINQSQERIDKGCALPLDGIPVAVKDIFCTKGVKTTCASKMLSNFVPQYNSTVTECLAKAGALMVGKTNMDEFAMGSNTNTGYYGACKNPYDTALSCGGSSGGSAISVASGSSILATGTDTGGSIRQPAALCGVYGMKPTYGLASRYGVIPYASSFDQAGMFTNCADDMALVMDTICCFDHRDSTSVPEDIRRKRGFNGFSSLLGTDVKGLKVGLAEDDLLSQINPKIANSVRTAAKKLTNAGAIVEENITIPYLKEALAVYFVLSPAECFSNLARYDGIRYGYSCVDADKITSVEELVIKNRTEGFGHEVRRRLLMGSFVLCVENYEKYYVHATKVRRLIKQGFDNLFEKFDILLLPITSNVATDPASVVDPLEVYLNDQFTVAINCAGLPGLSMPCGIEEETGLPLAIQLVSNAFGDAKILQVAKFLETA